MLALEPVANAKKAVLSLALLSAVRLALGGQWLSPGEVRLSSRPYAPTTAIRSESRLVELEVVVRDSQGRAVMNLAKGEFRVFDSGKSRDLTTFSVELFSPKTGPEPAALRKTPSETNQPPSAAQLASPTQSAAAGRWIVLLFDDLNTFPGELAHAKVASKRFIREAAADGDHIAVFDTSAGRIVDFTADTAAILAAVAAVESNPRIAPGGLASCPRMTAYEAHQIVNNDPNAMKAKVSEACHCSGGPSCDVESIPASELLDPTSRQLGAPNGGGELRSIVDSVLAQAHQTWDQAQLVSQATLEAIRASLDPLTRMHGRRMLLLASSGFLSGMLEQEQDAIVNDAVHAGVVINALDAKGLYAEAPGGPISESQELTEIPLSSTVLQVESLGDRLDSVDSAMARFAESTGGIFFRNNNDLDLGFYRLGVLPECTYLLGFPPAEDGKYHKLKVELKNKGRRFLEARPGYFAPRGASSHQPSATERIDAEVLGSDAKADFPAVESDTVKHSGSGARQLTIQTRVDLQKVPFQQQNGRHVEKLTFVAALFDPQGAFVTGKIADMELALKPESFERFSKTGISGVMSLEAAPGTYRLRVVVQEAMRGTLNASDKKIQIQ